MANLTSVGISSGVPSSGTGTVSTIDNLIAIGSPINNGSSSVIANLVGPSSTVTSSMTGLVTAIGYISSAVTLASVGSISSGTLTTVGTVNTVTTVTTVSAVTSITSGTMAIANGANVAAVKASVTAPSTTDPALVVSISPNSVNPNGAALSSNSSPVVAILSSLGFGGTNSSLSTPVVPADQYGGYAVVSSGQTQASVGTSAGRAGDYLAYVTVFPQSSNSGSVTIFDSTGTTVGTYAGASSVTLPSLAPFTIVIGAYSVSSGWKISTSSAVTALAVGKFT